jgi:hypothetical protein
VIAATAAVTIGRGFRSAREVALSSARRQDEVGSHHPAYVGSQALAGHGDDQQDRAEGSAVRHPRTKGVDEGRAVATRRRAISVVLLVAHDAAAFVE